MGRCLSLGLSFQPRVKQLRSPHPAGTTSTPAARHCPPELPGRDQSRRGIVETSTGSLKRLGERPKSITDLPHTFAA